MLKPNFNYDEASDTLYVSFIDGETATGIELTDNILLRLDTKDMRIIGLTLFDYSILIQQTNMGPRSFPVTGLTRLPTDLREQVLEILLQPPLSDLLAIAAYTPSIGEAITIICVRSLSAVMSAA